MPIPLGKLGVTPQKQKQFFTKGIYCAEDLARYMPRKYFDFTQETGILPETEQSCFLMYVKKIVYGGNAKTKVITALGTEPATGKNVRVTWFNQEYLTQKLETCTTRTVFVAGKAVYDPKWDNYTVTSPAVFEPRVKDAMRIYPVYSKIAGMSTEYLEKKLNEALRYPETTEEPLPEEIVAQESLLPMQKALYQVHFPKTMTEVEEAQKRLNFDDLTRFAVANEWAKRNSAAGSPFQIKTRSLMTSMIRALPYELTADQKNTIDAMLETANEGKRINALVQGDVGCGKTAVAFLSMAAFAGSGYQTVLMAPTKVLAQQHYEKLKALAEPLGQTVVYLGGELKASEQKKIKAEIASGEAKLIVGTHSVIGKTVTYHNLALVVADEEHKFGVAQRESLVNKAATGVHSITMSATPIPRSLAQVLYGNSMQMYSIVTKPNGRKDIITGVGKTREKTMSFLLKEARAGHQAFIVCPMIDSSETLENVRSVEELETLYKNALSPYGVRIATLTGRNSKEETERIIDEFRAGKTDILLATTVVEVGVDIPNATVMVIESADRFGLSQMHQLRGRVGRGDQQSYCVLLSDNMTDKARTRLEALCTTSNGFEVAMADLRQRGAGDILGTQQSGANRYMTLMLAYPDEYKRAQELAKALLDMPEMCPLVQGVLDPLEEGA